MLYLGTVEHAGNDEVGLGCDAALEYRLVESNAKLITYIKYTVARLGLTHGARALHILDKSHLVTVSVNLIIAVGAYRYHAEQIVTVRH